MPKSNPLAINNNSLAPPKSDSEVSEVLDGFLWKYGKGGKAKPKKKFVSFTIGKSGMEDAVLLSYGKDANSSMTDYVVLDVLPVGKLKASFEKNVEKRLFAVAVQDGKSEKEIVFQSENEKSVKIWTDYISALLRRMNTEQPV